MLHLRNNESTERLSY